MARGWSWTRYESQNTCGLQHDLRYVQNMPGKSKQDNYLVGRVVHKVIDAWAQNDWNDKVISAAIQYALRDEPNLRKSGFAVIASTTAKVSIAVDRTVELYKYLKLPEHQAIVEEKFSFPFMPGTRFTGAPDAYDPVEKLIVDIKTQKTGKGKPEQLYTYAWAEKLMGREVNKGVFVYPMQSGLPEIIEITQEHIEQQEQKFIEAATKDDKTPRKGDGCFFCEYEGTRHCTVTFRKTRPTFTRSPSGSAGKSGESDSST